MHILLKYVLILIVPILNCYHAYEEHLPHILLPETLSTSSLFFDPPDLRAIFVIFTVNMKSLSWETIIGVFYFPPPLGFSKGRLGH